MTGAPTCWAAGIIDPAKVTRSALQNAASSAALFLTTAAVVAEKPEKEKLAAVRLMSHQRTAVGRLTRRPH